MAIKQIFIGFIKTVYGFFLNLNPNFSNLNDVSTVILTIQVMESNT